MELIFGNEEKFWATMTDERKELFEKYIVCVQEPNCCGLSAVLERF
ncbi:hypothetical protein [uncultured Phascolarctobacterium sp.]